MQGSRRTSPFQSKPSIANSEAKSTLLDDKIEELERRGMSRGMSSNSRIRLGREKAMRSPGDSIPHKLPKAPTMRRNTRNMSDTRNHLYDSMMHEEGEQFVTNTNLDDPNISVELEQGRASNAGKLQHALLKQSAPIVHCAYMG